MESLAPIITALTTAISFLALLWIVRRTRRVNSVHFIFGVGVAIYTSYHFYACSVLGVLDPTHATISGLFITSVAIVNAYCSTCGTSSDITIGVCRRKDPTSRFTIDQDRRKSNSHVIFKDIVKSL